MESFSLKMERKILYENSYGFCGVIEMENKIFAYMRISTHHKTQKTDRQKQAIIEYSICNGFNIDEFISDTITGGTKADNRPNYHNMKKVIIETVDAKTAMLIAIGDFQCDGWIVDTDYEDYKINHGF